MAAVVAATVATIGVWPAPTAGAGAPIGNDASAPRALESAEQNTKLTRIGHFDAPVAVTSPPRDRTRVFIVEQAGQIHVVLRGKKLRRPFLDLTNEVKTGSENGLLGLAFAPDYRRSGTFYVYFSDRDDMLRLVEFSRRPGNANRAATSTRRDLLVIQKFSPMHNGGMLQFGSDGYLYLSIGDGGENTETAPGAFAQRLDDLRGSIIRIDPTVSGTAPYTIPADNPFVAVAGARGEILHYGLRNPWRFWLDGPSGKLYIGDVGALAREEINVLARGARGVNLGWPCREGRVAFNPDATCTGAIPPLFDYKHGRRNCAVIGGVIARDPRLPALKGRFLYADACGTALRSLRIKAGKPVARRTLRALRVTQVVSFGTDARSRVYVASFAGDVLRIDPRRR